MKFDYHQNPALPKLAWAAIVKTGSDTIRVHHGAGVEASEEFFVEGAWDSDYSDGRFDQSITFMGTGARLVEGEVMFCSPSHNLERCYSLEKGNSTVISNSLAFLMTLTGETLDPGYPYYYFDFVYSSWI